MPKRLSKQDWKDICTALYDAAKWEQSLADTMAGCEGYKDKVIECHETVVRYVRLRDRFKEEGRGV